MDTPSDPLAPYPLLRSLGYRRSARGAWERLTDYGPVEAYLGNTPSELRRSAAKAHWGFNPEQPSLYDFNDFIPSPHDTELHRRWDAALALATSSDPIPDGYAPAPSWE